MTNVAKMFAGLLCYEFVSLTITKGVNAFSNESIIKHVIHVTQIRLL